MDETVVDPGGGWREFRDGAVKYELFDYGFRLGVKRAGQRAFVVKLDRAADSLDDAIKQYEALTDRHDRSAAQS